MPFDGSGNYALSDTIAPATNADANELQAILDDIAVALDKCVVADGQSTITGTLKGADGTALLPAYTFASDLNSGLYRIGSDNIGLSLGGTKRVDFLTTGVSITGTLTASGQILSSDGTKTAPGYSFSGDLDTGVYRIGANNIGVSCGDTKIIDITTTGVSITGTFGFTGDFAINTNKFTVTASNGNTLVAGTLNVTGLITGSHAAPTIQRLTSGTGATYTPTAGMVRIRGRMIGPGGGGGARATNNGANGSGATIFGGWNANPGGGGTTGGGAPGAGGTGGADGTGTLITRFTGAAGNTGQNGTAGTTPGGNGGVSPFGGAGNSTIGTPTVAVANTGSGGGGTGGASPAASGGGAGEYVEFWMTAAQVGASVTYTIGTGGAGGAAGTVAGGNGASGVIIIEEFYS